MIFRLCIYASGLAFGLVLAVIHPAAAQGEGLAARLRQEISVLEERMRSGEAQRRNAVELLQDTERKVELRRRLIREMEKQIETTSSRIKKLDRNLQGLENEIASLSTDLRQQEYNLEKLRSEIGTRVAQAYRQMRGDKLLLLLAARDPAGLARKRQYLNAIQKYDRRQIQVLSRSRDIVAVTRDSREQLHLKITLDKTQRLVELEKLRNLMAGCKNEERALQEEKRQKQALVAKIESDNALLRTMLEERRKSLVEIEREINRLQQAPRPASALQWTPDVPFKQLVGKLPWPVESSRIVQPFGPSRHPQLGTTTVNPGIDLAASPGDIVRAVAAGQVTKIAWLRGFGNTIIIDHNEGYYTVYARLERIAVSEGEVVQLGQPLGSVGESGGSSDFHFEVWDRREKQNPLEWLKK